MNFDNELAQIKEIKKQQEEFEKMLVDYIKKNFKGCLNCFGIVENVPFAYPLDTTEVEYDYSDYLTELDIKDIKDIDINDVVIDDVFSNDSYNTINYFENFEANICEANYFEVNEFENFNANANIIENNY